MKISTRRFSKEEIFILEAKLFTHMCEELKELFRKEYKSYFRLMKFTAEKENTMLEINFVRLIMRDILSSEEYTLEGIARYSDTHEDVIQEILTGRNTSPSAKLLQRIIKLHQSIRCDFYDTIMKKIAMQYYNDSSNIDSTRNFEKE